MESGITKIPYSLSLLCVVLLRWGCIIGAFAPAVREQFQTVTEPSPGACSGRSGFEQFHYEIIEESANTQDDWVEYISRISSSLMKDVTNIFTLHSAPRRLYRPIAGVHCL